MKRMAYPDDMKGIAVFLVISIFSIYYRRCDSSRWRINDNIGNLRMADTIDAIIQARMGASRLT